MNPRSNAARPSPQLPIRRARLHLASLAAVAAWSLALSATPAAAQTSVPANPDLATASTNTTGDYANRPEVRAFVTEMVERHGFIESELLQAFAHVRHNDQAVRLMTPAPTTAKRSWQAYRSRFLDTLRIREGLRFWREHEKWLDRAAARYGVPPEIIVAIIGVETIYGRRTGEHRVLDVLATLAFDYPRRADYFRSELGEFLLFSREANLDVFAARGSFAGAIGLPQFMPGSIRRFAIDFDEDGRVDLQSSAADAIGSVANFLAEHGWRAGEPVRFEMLFDSEGQLVPLIEAGIRPQFTIDELAGYGVSSAEPVSFEMPLALIDLPNGDDSTSYYLGAPNFFTITRYNRSSFYAMAVYELARTLAARR